MSKSEVVTAKYAQACCDAAEASGTSCVDLYTEIRKQAVGFFCQRKYNNSQFVLCQFLLGLINARLLLHVCGRIYMYRPILIIIRPWWLYL